MTQMDRRTFLAASVGGAVAGGTGLWPREEGWRSLASAPWSAQEIYCAVWRGGILTAGGLVGRPGGQLHIEDRTAFYSPADDRWTEGPKLPAPRHHPMILATDEAAYALGGYGRSDAGDWTAMTDVWRLEDGAWIAAGTMPQRQCETVGAVVDGRIHLITGRAPVAAPNGNWNDQGDIDLHQVWSPGDDRWETARPNPMARNSAAAAVLDGAIWVAGGRRVGGSGTGQLDRYDPAEDRWDTLRPIPRSFAANNQVGGGLAMAAAGGKLVAFGGEWFRSGGGGGVFAETWIYDPATDVWTEGPAMKTPRHGLGAAAIGDTVYAVSGGAVVSGGAASGTLEAIDLSA